MKRAGLIFAAALAALLLFAGCGQNETAEQSDILSEAASEEPAVDTPTAGRYAVMTAGRAEDASGEAHPAVISALTLLADGSGSLTESGEETSLLWRCEAGELTLMLSDGRVLTGEMTGADTLGLLSDGVSYTFTRAGDASQEVTEDATAAVLTGSTTTSIPADADPFDEDNIYGAAEPEAYEDDTPTDDYITLGDYGAVGITDADGEEIEADGDIIHLITAETDPSAGILVTGKGTYLTADSYLLFRYKLSIDGTFRAYWCDSGPDEYTGDFMQEVMTGSYIDDTLVLTDLAGNQYRFELDAVPEQTHDYEYTADNKYGGALPCAWD